jgi:hypothetical protein
VSEIGERLSERATSEGLPLEVILRRHLLHGVLRRWSRSSQADALVLRGGLLTQLWVGAQRRVTRDVDFLGLFPRDLDDTKSRLTEILKTVEADGVSFDVGSLRGEVIWQETAFPGLRFLLDCSAAGQAMDLQIDVGFGDPLVPAAQWVDYPTLLGSSVRVQAVRPELLVAWKLDGLFDHGPKRWPAKDLFDLYLLTAHCQFDLDVLTEAIRVAFEAHADPLDALPDVLYSRAWWETDGARNKWAKFLAQATVSVPGDLLEVAATVGRRLRPALARLVVLPDENEWPYGEPRTK